MFTTSKTLLVNTLSNPSQTCIVKILCFPISNAEVERVFSQITLLKNSLRSQMKLNLLEAILNCKFGLSKNNQQVTDFKPPSDILNYPFDLYN